MLGTGARASHPHVRVVEHGPQVGVHLLADEAIKARNVADVKAKGVSTDGLEDVVELRRRHHGDVDELDVREVAHELHPQADVADLRRARREVSEELSWKYAVPHAQS